MFITGKDNEGNQKWAAITLESPVDKHKITNYVILPREEGQKIISVSEYEATTKHFYFYLITEKEGKREVYTLNYERESKKYTYDKVKFDISIRD